MCKIRKSQARNLIFVAGLFLLVIGTNQAVAQNVYRDYVVDKHAQYQPGDTVNRGAIYRVQTGHGGLFKYCDDDLYKMNSPYIIWSCRPQRKQTPVANLLDEIQTKKKRFLAGAGNCLQIIPRPNVTNRCLECEHVDGTITAEPTPLELDREVIPAPLPVNDARQ